MACHLSGLQAAALSVCHFYHSYFGQEELFSYLCRAKLRKKTELYNSVTIFFHFTSCLILVSSVKGAKLSKRTKVGLHFAEYRDNKAVTRRTREVLLLRFHNNEDT